jgi:hypothetical protein
MLVFYQKYFYLKIEKNHRATTTFTFTCRLNTISTIIITLKTLIAILISLIWTRIKALREIESNFYKIINKILIILNIFYLIIKKNIRSRTVCTIISR